MAKKTLIPNFVQFLTVIPTHIPIRQLMYSHCWSFLIKGKTIKKEI